MDPKEATAGATPAIDLAAITKSVTDTVTAAVTKAVTEKYDKVLDDLTKNVGVLADTLKNAPPAAKEEKKPEDGKASAAAALSPEAVAKLVQDGIAAHEKARGDDAQKKAARDELVAKVTKEKLGGDADLAKFLTGDDEAALAASADALAGKIKTFKPDFGGVAKDGGTVPAGETGKSTNHNLAPGTAKFAESIKLPA